MRDGKIIFVERGYFLRADKVTPVCRVLRVKQGFVKSFAYRIV